MELVWSMSSDPHTPGLFLFLGEWLGVDSSTEGAPAPALAADTARGTCGFAVA